MFFMSGLECDIVDQNGLTWHNIGTPGLYPEREQRRHVTFMDVSAAPGSARARRSRPLWPAACGGCRGIHVTLFRRLSPPPPSFPLARHETSGHGTAQQELSRQVTAKVDPAADDLYRGTMDMAGLIPRVKLGSFETKWPDGRCDASTSLEVSGESILH